jgi:YHS domain-containing protein
MLRFIILSILLTLLLRALSRFWSGIVEGLGSEPRRRSSVPQQGTQMVRDPVCGTYLLPARAITLSIGGRLVHFCSAACRDNYRTKSSSNDTSRQAHGRIA